MTNFAEGLREKANSWSAAYISFETGRLREGFAAYAFVEDDDDKVFYQLALTERSDIKYLGCGGKSGVIKVFEKLDSEGKAQHNLFFVDRDTEHQPFVHGADVLRTAMYSWESHVAEPQFVAWVLQRRVEPNLNPQEQNDVNAGWLSTLESFKNILDTHTAYCRTALVLEASLKMDEVNVVQNATFNNMAMYPGPDATAWYSEKKKLAIAKGVLEADIERRLTRYSLTLTRASCKGKLLFDLLRAFVKKVLNFLERSFVGEYNSAKAWIQLMPWTSPELDYVRDYARLRVQ